MATADALAQNMRPQCCLSGSRNGPEHLYSGERFHA